MFWMQIELIDSNIEMLVHNFPKCLIVLKIILFF